MYYLYMEQIESKSTKINCQDCSKEFVFIREPGQRGRNPVACQECREKRAKALEPKGQITIVCKVCDTPFSHSGRGRRPSTCQSCRDAQEQLEIEQSEQLENTDGETQIILGTCIADVLLDPDALKVIRESGKPIFMIDRTFSNPDAQLRYGQYVKLVDKPSPRDGFVVAVGTQNSLKGWEAPYNAKYLYTVR